MLESSRQRDSANVLLGEPRGARNTGSLAHSSFLDALFTSRVICKILQYNISQLMLSEMDRLKDECEGKPELFNREGQLLYPSLNML